MKLPGVLKVVIATCALSLIAAHLSPATAAPAAQVITCVDLASGKERISKTDTCRITEATAKWRLAPTDSALASGSTTKSLTICSNKESSSVTYQRIRTTCYKHMQTKLYIRSAALPSKPVITQVSSNSYDSASLALASDPAANLDAPIAYYTITSSKGDVMKVNSWRELRVTVSGLRSATSYTFTITATSVDGTSPVSASSLPVTTQVYVAPVAAATAAPLAVPAFTLSAAAETKTVNTAIAGYTISSTGGTIASYAISPSAPTGTTFSTSTGLLTGTPASTQGATAYTFTATNASGSATQTFTLTVTAIVYSVGDTGPGGGKIFYVATTPFACGPTRSASCTYLEAAPSGWNTGIDPRLTWAQSTPVNYQSTAVNNASSPETATATAIGWGYRNTRAIILQGNSDTATSAAALADSYTVTVSGVAFDDWYLPSGDELNQMCKWQRGISGANLTTLTTVCTGGTLNSGTGAAGFVASWYLSSSETYTYTVLVQNFATGGQSGGGYKDSDVNYVRPVRAF
ncbi:Fibronectin type III [Candidatus Planktophila versatilis]|uniref:putative Ig domain-containing protein n=1 Tax=Candidatus Planktophila versatilis TaxID=1884905 RepID=UPI003BEF119D